MNNEIFISNSITKAIKLYLDNKEKDYSLEFNSFLCTIFRMLVLIYGEKDIVASYKENNSEKFDICLMKYGLNIEKVDEFKIVLEKYYKLSEKQEKKAIKKKNKFFNIVQKDIIDMMIQKKEKEPVSPDEIKIFYDLLFTANSKNFYRKSVAIVEAYNPYEIDTYAQKKLFETGEWLWKL